MKHILRIFTWAIAGTFLAMWAGHRYQHNLDSPCEIVRARGEPFAMLISANPQGSDIPREWKNAPIEFGFESLVDPVMRQMYTAVISEELSKYNREAVSTFISRIFIVKSLHFSGVRALGTEGHRVIWIATVDRNGKPFSVPQVRATLHHELGSAIFHGSEGAFPKMHWWGNQPPIYQFPNDVIEAVKQGKASVDLNLDLLNEGFLTEYSRTALYKDFATLHEWMMTAPEAICALRAGHDKLSVKVDVWLSYCRRWNLLPQ